MGSSVWVWPQDTWRGPFDSFPQDQNLVVGILILSQKQDSGINFKSGMMRNVNGKKTIISDKDNSESSEKMSEEIVVL